MKILLRAALIGLLLGALAGMAETAWLKWSGVRFPPLLLVYAAILDGLVLAGAGFAVGLAWVLARAAFRAWSHPSAPASAEPALAPVSRRTLLRLAAGTAAGVALAGSGALVIQRLISPQRSVSRARAAEPVIALDAAETPNVLLVTIDTLRADQLGCYGHPYLWTPALDSVASGGARFVWHFAEMPQTNPSHASMFTGMYPASSGLRLHMVDKLPDSVETLATLFFAAGYQTAGLFSWMSFQPQYSGLQRGFQLYRDVTVPAAGLLANPVVAEAAARYRVAEQYLQVPKLANKVVPLKAQVESSAKGRADLTTAAAVAQLRALAGAPFFLWVHYFDPHFPYEPPAPIADFLLPGYQGTVDGSMRTINAVSAGELRLEGPDLRRLIALYEAEVVFLDQQLGQLFLTLDELGLTDKTIVAVTGDHGESFAEHDDLIENGSFFHPRSLYNTEQRIPLLLRYPPLIHPGSVVQPVTESIDLFPTLLQLAGLRVPDQSQGKSLLPLLSGDAGADRAGFAMMPDNVFTSIVAGQWKLIQNNASGLRRLYDLAGDLGETRNLLDGEPEVARDLSRRLDSWMREVRLA